MKELSTEQKARAYDEAIERAKEYHNADIDNTMDVKARGIMEYLFPELVDSKDERIRKSLVDYFNRFKSSDMWNESFSFGDVVSWIEKQGTERKQLYVRFGDIPSNEKSKIYCGEEEIGEENGVSVYPAFELNGNIVLGLTLPITKTTLHTQQHLIEYDDRPCYLVKGDYIGKDADGQPLINNVSIIKKIDSYRVKEENQDEQKSVDKSEPKFKIGDTVKDPFGGVYHIIEINNDSYKTDEGRFILFTNENAYTVFTPAELEKQGGQKAANKVEPKFKVGDWIVHDMSDGRKVIRQIVNMTNKSYILDGEDFNVFYFNDLENDYHLWTIQDAKDGDILACNEEILLFKSYSVQGHISLYCWYNGQTNNFHSKGVDDTLLTTRNKIYPASKEQCDLLFQKIKEAGYEWNSEKKELSKYICFTKTMTSEKVSPAWSKEDDIYIENIILAVEKQYPTAAKDIVNWLKSLKNRINNFYA